MARSSLSLLFLLASTICAGCTRPGSDAVLAAGKDDAKKPAEAAAPAAGPPLRVLVVKPERKTLLRTTEQPGQIIAYEETPVYSKIAAFVDLVHVDIGDEVAGPQRDSHGATVKEGQLLALLSVPETEEELKQKVAMVAQAEATITQAQAAVRVAVAAKNSAEAKRAEAQAAIARTEADYKAKRSEFARATELAATSSVTPKLVDEAENQFLAADAARKEASAKVLSADAGAAQAAANVSKAQADELAAQAGLRVAQADQARVKALLGYTQIRAPFDGVVTQRNVHTGHLVQPGNTVQGKPLFVVVRTDPVRIIVDVPESEAGLTGPKDQARIRIPSVSAEEIKGKVTRIAWVLDTTSRTLRTVIDIPNPNGKYRPGMYANSSLTVAERPNVLVLPVSAIGRSDNQSFCWAVEKGRLVKKPVTLGLKSGSEIEIASGLKGDEEIVKTNAPTLAEGQPVEPAKP